MVSDFLKDCSPVSEAQPALQKLRWFLPQYIAFVHMSSINSALCYNLILQFCSLPGKEATVYWLSTNRGHTFHHPHPREKQMWATYYTSYLTAQHLPIWPLPNLPVTTVCSRWFVTLRRLILKLTLLAQLLRQLSTETPWRKNIFSLQTQDLLRPAAERDTHAAVFQQNSKTRLLVQQMKTCPRWASKRYARSYEAAWTSTVLKDMIFWPVTQSNGRSFHSAAGGFPRLCTASARPRPHPFAHAPVTPASLPSSLACVSCTAWAALARESRRRCTGTSRAGAAWCGDGGCVHTNLR